MFKLVNEQAASPYSLESYSGNLPAQLRVAMILSFPTTPIVQVFMLGLFLNMGLRLVCGQVNVGWHHLSHIPFQG